MPNYKGTNWMTDRERFVALLDATGIVWTSRREQGSLSRHHQPMDHYDAIEVNTEDGPHQIGYRGFYFVFAFDAEGKLHHTECWE